MPDQSFHKYNNSSEKGRPLASRKRPRATEAGFGPRGWTNARGSHRTSGGWGTVLVEPFIKSHYNLNKSHCLDLYLNEKRPGIASDGNFSS